MIKAYIYIYKQTRVTVINKPIYFFYSHFNYFQQQHKLKISYLHSNYSYTPYNNGKSFLLEVNYGTQLYDDDRFHNLLNKLKLMQLFGFDPYNVINIQLLYAMAANL